MTTRRAPPALALGLAAVLSWAPQTTGAGELPTWSEIVARAQGQEVFWNAWGGDERINTYITWVGDRVAAEFGIELRHVKLSDTAEAVSRVLAEKAAGRDADGSIDLIWINGENFAAMKANGLLFGPFAEALPNYGVVDVEGKPSISTDFTVPVEGLEAPWGQAQLNFIYDSARLPDPPRSVDALLAWAEANPGRFTYPQPPDFTGSSFLKQILISRAAEPQVLQRPVETATFEKVTGPLWDYLDALNPHLWRDGAVFPATGPAQRQLLDDGEVDITISFYPSEAASLIRNGLLPESARPYVLDEGTIGNTHFVAIPYNARAKEGAMVVANFLMSPEAQARKLDPAHWGDHTVLAMDKLDAAGRALFDALPRDPATLRPEDLGRVLLEPHPSWMTDIEAEWQRRYTR